MHDTLWSSLQAVMGAIGPHYQEVANAVLQDMGYERGDWFVGYLAYGLEPEPLTAVSLQALLPYGPREANQLLLDGATQRGFLDNVRDTQYALSATGRLGNERFFSEAWAVIGQLKPLPAADLDNIAGCLGRVVTATLAAPEPSQKPHLAISRRTDPGRDVTALVRIDQYVTDLQHYRDDAHVAAWSVHDIGGPAWEMLTFFWRGDVTGPADFTDKLPTRGLEQVDFDKPLQALLQAGWLAADGTTIAVTDAGRAIREEAERQTEANFMVGLNALDAAEQTTLLVLLQQLTDTLALAAPEPAVA